MGRKNADNLIPNSQRSPSELRAQTSKGGKKSGETRRRNADLRKAIQAALDAEYTDKNGKKFTGIEGIAQVLVVKSLDKKDKDCISAIKYLCDLMGANRTDERIERDKAEIKLLEAKLKAYASENITAETEMPKLYEALGATDDDIL